MRLFILSSDENTEKIYKHAGFSAVITDSFSSPAANLAGIAWDNTNVYSSDYTSGKIYKHTGFTSSISDSFSSPSTAPTGLTYDGTNIYSADTATDKIYKHTGFSSSITDSFSGPSSNTTGLTWDGTNIYSADGNTDKIYKHTGFTSSISDSFSSPGSQPRGLAWDGTNIYTSDTGTDKIYKHTGFTSSITDSFSSPSTVPVGIAWDSSQPPEIVDGENFDQAAVGIILDQGVFRGRLRVYQDVYEAMVLSAGSTIRMGPPKLPKGIRVVAIVIFFDALGGGVTLSVGDTDDDNRYIDAVSAASAGSKRSDQVGGISYKITGVDDDEIIIKTAGGPATGTIKIAIVTSEE